MKDRYILLFLLTGMFFIVFIITSIGHYHTQEGEKVGNVVKCARQGIIFKTMECELMRGGLDSGSGAMGRSFHFTVKDKNLNGKLFEALDKQKRVKLNYHKEMWTFFGSESHDYFADNVVLS